MKTAIYPGTFDPITNGHIDILKKATNVFDRVIVAVANVTGKDTMFTLEERTNLCKEACVDIPGVDVMDFDGLSVDLAKKVNACAMIRGLRAVSDFEYELALALMNKRLKAEIETVFFVPDSEYLYLSSTSIREVAKLGRSVADMVPACVDFMLRYKNSGGKND